MKTKFVIILIVAVIVVSSLAGWFCKGYYDANKKIDFIADMPDPVATDTVLYPIEVHADTGKFMAIIADLKGKLEASLSNNKVNLKPTCKESLPVQTAKARPKLGIKVPEPKLIPTKFEYTHFETVGDKSVKMFTLWQTAYAPCSVNRIETIVKPDLSYMREIARNTVVPDKIDWKERGIWAMVGAGLYVTFSEMARAF